MWQDDMAQWTLLEWLVAAGAVAAIVMIVVAILAWRFPRRAKEEPDEIASRYRIYPGSDSPTIHATSGVPTLSQLLEGIDLDPKKLDLAGRLYKHGLEQFNRFVNNRDGVIEDSRRQMASLATSLDQSELYLAESTGVSLASTEDCEQRAEVQQQYNDLSPQAQIYAQHKRRETDALRRIARDLETNTPRTDYTSVKSRIASGNVNLDTLLSELPFFWQRIRSLDEKVERPGFKGKPPKRELLHVKFMTRDHGLLEDKRAEKDGNWIISDKHSYMVPYQPPADLWEGKEFGKPLIWKGKAVIITHDATSEWETEFWRQGGRMDQVYQRAARGESPEQLQSAYRRRQINNFGWVAGTAFLIADIIMLGILYL